MSVPPGRYKVVIRDGVIKESVVEGGDVIEVLGGESKRVVVRLAKKLTHLNVRIREEAGVQWAKAMMSVWIDGKRLHGQVFHNPAVMDNSLPPVVVPVGHPFEIMFESPEVERVARLVTLDSEQDHVELILMPAK